MTPAERIAYAERLASLEVLWLLVGGGLAAVGLLLAGFALRWVAREYAEGRQP